MATFHQSYLLKGETVVLRSLTPEDAEEMIAYMHALDQETTFLTREPGEFAMTLSQERAFLEGALMDPRHLFLCAQVQGRIAGSAHVVLGAKQRTRHTADFGIAILRAHWGKGIGRTLMDTCIRWARGMGAERIRLDVVTENLRALSLYQRFGFIVEGRFIRDIRLANGTYYDTYRMALDLTKGQNT